MELLSELIHRLASLELEAFNLPVMQPDSPFAAGRGDEPRGPYHPVGGKSRQLGAEPGEDDMLAIWTELLFDERATPQRGRKRRRRLIDEDTRAPSFDLAP